MQLHPQAKFSTGIFFLLYLRLFSDLHKLSKIGTIATRLNILADFLQFWLAVMFAL